MSAMSDITTFARVIELHFVPRSLAALQYPILLPNQAWSPCGDSTLP